MRLRALVLAIAVTGGCSRNEPSPPSGPEPTAPPSTPTKAAIAAPPIEPPPPPSDPSPPPDAAPPPPTRSFDDVAGLTTAELVAHWGDPDAKTGDRWTYKFPRKGCTEERLVYVLQLRAGKVAKIDRRSEQTGKVCAPIE